MRVEIAPKGAAAVRRGHPWLFREARALATPADRVVVLGSFHTVGPALEWLGL